MGWVSMDAFLGEIREQEVRVAERVPRTSPIHHEIDVDRLGQRSWAPMCSCGWSTGAQTFILRRDAVAAGRAHTAAVL